MRLGPSEELFSLEVDPARITHNAENAEAMQKITAYSHEYSGLNCGHCGDLQ